MCGGDSDKRSTEILMNSERKQNVEDSLSSISIESEDDSNLLSQVSRAFIFFMFSVIFYTIPFVDNRSWLQQVNEKSFNQQNNREKLCSNDI